MAKEFTISSMDPDVTTVRGLSTDTVYTHKENDRWAYQEEIFGEDVAISWCDILAKEGKVIEVPFAEVGSIVQAVELDRLPLMTVIRGSLNDMVYVKVTPTELLYSQGNQFVLIPISQLRHRFRVEWIDEEEV